MLLRDKIGNGLLLGAAVLSAAAIIVLLAMIYWPG